MCLKKTGKRPLMDLKEEMVTLRARFSGVGHADGRVSGSLHEAARSRMKATKARYIRTGNWKAGGEGWVCNRMFAE